MSEFILTRSEDILPNIRTYCGVVKSKDLPQCTVPIYNSNQTSGALKYQRFPPEARINAVRDRFLSYMEKPGRDITRIDRSALIDNINLNIRSSIVGSEYINPLRPGVDIDEPGYLFRLAWDESLGPAYIVDGQTRYTGLQNAIAHLRGIDVNEAADYLDNLHLKITFTFADDPLDEAIIFYMLNKYSKPLQTEGAERILYEGYKEGNDLFLDELNKQKNDDFVDTYAIAERLNETQECVWFDLVGDYNSSAKRPIKMGIMAKKVVKPIRDEIKAKYSGESGIEEATYKTICAAWDGIKMVFPECFEDYKSENKPEYSMLKSSCAEAMSNFLADLLKIANSNKHDDLKDKNFSPIKAEDWQKILNPTLNGFSDTNLDGDKKEGLDCWKAGKIGTIGKYTSQGAKKQLSEMLMRSCRKNYLET